MNESFGSHQSRIYQIGRLHGVDIGYRAVPTQEHDPKAQAKIKAKSGMGFTNIPRAMIDEIKQKKKLEEK